MSFFQTSDGQAIESNNSFDSGGGDIDPIPNNTGALGACTEAKWASFEGSPDYINLTWTIMRPEAYKGRKVFQKVQVNADDPKKADKAKRMLVAIDANAGGKLVKAGKEPTDESLTAALVNKAMGLQIMLWQIKEDDAGNELPQEQWKSGNWIRAVCPKDDIVLTEPSKESTAPPRAAAPRPAPRPAGAAPARRPAPQAAGQPAPAADFDSFDDDIPF